MEVIKIPKKQTISFYSKKLKVAAYIRVSTKLEKQIGSYESQYNYYKNKILQNSNWTLVGIYGDYGVSGTKTIERTEFSKMIKDALQGKIDLIVTKSVSRFSRDSIDTLKYVRKLKSNGIGIIFEEEHINTLNMSGEMLLTVFSSISQMDINEVSKRVSYGYYMHVKNNTYRNTQKSYGYKRDNKKNVLIINIKEARVVKNIFKYYDSGFSLQQIANLLNSKRIKCVKRKNWTAMSVRFILKNPKYTGDYVANFKSRDQKFIIKNNNPQIIDINTFERVQEEIRNRSKNKNYKKRNIVFSKKIYCGFCGYRLVYLTKNNDINRSWICVATNTHINKCSAKAIPENVLKESFVDLINRIALLKTDDLKQKINNYEKGLVSNKLNILNNSISLVFDKYINKKISKNEFEKEYKELQNKKELLIIQNNKLEMKKLITDNYKKVLMKTKDKISKDNTSEFNKKLFDEIIQYAILGKILLSGRKSYYSIRFILKDDFLGETESKIKILNNKYHILFEFIHKTSFLTKTQENKRKIIKNIRVSLETVEE